MNYKPFNINNKVKVKLTGEGLRQHRAYYAELFEDFKFYPYPKVEVDKDGYSEFQLWHLIQIFGPHISMGSAPAFETKILIEE